jgi:hypothetical protein
MTMSDGSEVESRRIGDDVLMRRYLERIAERERDEKAGRQWVWEGVIYGRTK